MHTYNSCVISTLPESSSRSPSPVSGVKPVPTAAWNTNEHDKSTPLSFPHDAKPHGTKQDKKKSPARDTEPQKQGALKKTRMYYFYIHSVFTRVRYVPSGIRTRCRLPPLADRATILTSRRSPSETCPAGGGAGAAMLASRRTWRGTSARIPSIASPSLSV